VHKLFIVIKKEQNETVFHFKLDSFWYLDTCPKNDVILFFRKRFCALALGLGLD